VISLLGDVVGKGGGSGRMCKMLTYAVSNSMAVSMKEYYAMGVKGVTEDL